MRAFRTPMSLIVIATAGLTGAAVAQSGAPLPPKQFVAMAGASDKFEIAEAQLMVMSKNPDIKTFAQKMIADHTDSTMKVKAAAKTDGVMPAPPKLTAKQASDLAALRKARGTDRDALYITQQKAAHQEALNLHQTEASSGTTAALKQTSSLIVPVVQTHLDMLNQMPGQMSGM